MARYLPLFLCMATTHLAPETFKVSSYRAQQTTGPQVTPVLGVALAATHFCGGKVKPKAKSSYLLSYGQFATSGVRVAHHQFAKALFYLNSSYRDLFS